MLQIYLVEEEKELNCGESHTIYLGVHCQRGDLVLKLLCDELLELVRGLFLSKLAYQT